MTALIEAIKAKDEARVRALLDAGADVNERDGGHRTPLQLAVHHDLTEITELLLNRGADIEADMDGWTALHFAVGVASPVTVALLLSRGASVKALTNDDETPLHWAAYNDRYSSEITKLLIDAGAALDAKNMYGQTPLWEAAHYRRLEMAALLLARYPAAAEDAETAELLRTNFDPVALSDAVANASNARNRRLNVIRAYYHSRGGSRRRKSTRRSRRLSRRRR